MYVCVDYIETGLYSHVNAFTFYCKLWHPSQPEDL